MPVFHNYWPGSEVPPQCNVAMSKIISPTSVKQSLINHLTTTITVEGRTAYAHQLNHVHVYYLDVNA